MNKSHGPKEPNLISLVLTKKRIIFVSLSIMILCIITDLLSPIIMKQIIDTALPNQDFKLLVPLILGLMFLPILSTILTSIRTTLNIEIGGYVTDSLRRKMFNKLFILSPKNLNLFSTGDIFGRITRSCGTVGEVFIGNELLPGISNILMFFGMVTFMIFLSWKLTILSLFIIPLAVFITHMLGKKSERETGKYASILQEADSKFTELIAGMKTVQIFAQQEKEKTDIDNWLKRHKKQRLISTVYRRWFISIFSQFERSFALGIVFAFGAWEISNNQLTIGSLIAFTVYVPQLYGTVEQIQSAYVGMLNMQPHLKKIDEILSINENIIDNINTIPMQDLKGEIEFRDVSFSYGDERSSITNTSFHIKPGEVLGIVGPSGGGKTTILELLMRFYEPSNGKVLIDGVDIRDYSVNDLRKHVGIVSQDIFLWNRTILENLTYGMPNIDMEKVISAVKAAQLDTFIDNLPNGYETMVGERGVRISGGEKQRLAIARAILKDPQIILLDEPTSALDAHTESLLQYHLEEIFKGKTFVVVAHRLATVRNASKIMVIDSGMVSEFGSPQDLLDNNGAYLHLLSKQSQLVN